MKTILFALALGCTCACGNPEAPSSSHSTGASSSAKSSGTAYAQDHASPPAKPAEKPAAKAAEIPAAKTTENPAAKAAESKAKASEKPKPADVAKAPDAPKDKADLALAEDVRRTIDEDETLSLAAKTITAIAHGGTVTLKGSVPSEADKEQVEACVAKVPGVQHVDNQITLKPS